MRDAREHDVRDARVDEVEVRQLANRPALKRAVPRMRPCQIRTQRQPPQSRRVVVEDSADLAHIGEPVVVFRA